VVLASHGIHAIGTSGSNVNEYVARRDQPVRESRDLDRRRRVIYDNGPSDRSSDTEDFLLAVAIWEIANAHIPGVHVIRIAAAWGDRSVRITTVPCRTEFEERVPDRVPTMVRWTGDDNQRGENLLFPSDGEAVRRFQADRPRPPQE